MRSHNRKPNRKPLILAILIAVVVLFAYLYYTEGTLPVDRSDTSLKTFEIKPGENLQHIAQQLDTDDLIRNKLVFFLIVKRLGIEKNIQAGQFRLSPSMSAEEVAKSLTHGTLDEWVTIIEGLRKEEIADIIAKKFDVKEIEFTQLAPEGYLFPETYQFPAGASAQTIIDKMTATFNDRYTPEMQAKAARLNLTKQEVITLASLVEREARTEHDRQQVASILLKRLKNDWPLQLDATVQYAIGYQPGEKTWWKKDLTEDDLKIDSPYNTYANEGLPPGPICNPSISSVQAVVEADPGTPYWYYLSDLKGVTHFAKTLEEHNANVQKYLR